jgi:hypothetical protein
MRKSAISITDGTTIVGRDLEGLMELYAEDAILETPRKAEIGPFFSRPGSASSGTSSTAGTAPVCSFPTGGN